MLHLLELLKSEIWQTTPPGDAFADADWAAIFAESRRQAVTALAANALERVTDNRHLPPLPLAARWLAEAETIRQTGRQMDEKLAALLAVCARAGISPIVLKGQTIAALYPDPHARQCGDIDLFIMPGQRPAMDRFLSDSSIAVTSHSDGSQSFMWQGVEVEIHPRIFDIHSPLSRRRLSRLIPLIPQFGKGEACLDLNARIAQIPQFPQFGTVETNKAFGKVETCLDLNNAGLAPESALLLLSAHILKHAMGRGIGLRQLCDLAVASSALHDALDPGLLRHIFHAAGLRRWTSTVYSFLTIYLGLPSDRLPYHGITISRRRADRLLRIVARSGNFNSPSGETCLAPTKYGYPDHPNLSPTSGIPPLGSSEAGHTSPQPFGSPEVDKAFGTVETCLDLNPRKPVVEACLDLNNAGRAPRHSGRMRFIATALSFIRRSRFSLLTAPAEAFWTVATLIKGRFRNHRTNK